LPLAFGADQRSIGRIDFASFAMLDMPGQRSRLGAYAIRPREERSPFWHCRTFGRAIRRLNSFLKLFFCRHQAKDLRQIRTRRNLTT
jgi:hypothetical protein